MSYLNIFITGTDTNVGKTIISSWLAYHTGFSYFKPIQTGSNESTDSIEVHKLTDAKIYPETYIYKEPLSPHLAANIENSEIDINNIKLPKADNLIIEGAGGILVPINEKHLMIDLIKKLDTPVILVARSSLGTINHTLLTLEVLKQRNIKVLGVIVNGEKNEENCKAIEFYGNTKILAQFPRLELISSSSIKKIQLTQDLKQIFKVMT